MAVKTVHAYRDFARAVSYHYRFARTPEQQDFLNFIVATSTTRTLTMKSGCILWRAQLGHDWRTVEQDGIKLELPTAFPISRMKPLAKFATDGRASPKGIPCLYMATHQKTAALEIRPIIGSYISIAQFNINRDLKIVDCSKREAGNLEFLDPNPTAEKLERIAWTDINYAFSEPVQRSDASLDYVPTQIIAESLRLGGADGVAYKSTYGEDGFNIALFDIASADLINCQLHRVKDMSVRLSEEDVPYFTKDT